MTTQSINSQATKLSNLEVANQIWRSLTSFCSEKYLLLNQNDLLNYQWRSPIIFNESLYLAEVVSPIFQYLFGLCWFEDWFWNEMLVFWFNKNFTTLIRVSLFIIKNKTFSSLLEKNYSEKVTAILNIYLIFQKRKNQKNRHPILYLIEEGSTTRCLQIKSIISSKNGENLQFSIFYWEYKT